MEEYFTERDVISELKTSIGLASQVEFAEKLGISQQLLCDILAGRRRPAKSVLVHLGLERAKQMYRRVGKVKR